MTDRDEQNLLARCIDGDPSAWREFVSRMIPYLAQAIANFLRRKAPGLAAHTNVDEVLQDTFLTVWKNDRRVLRKYDGTSPLKTYLAAVALHRAHHFLSSRKPMPLLTDEELERLAQTPDADGRKDTDREWALHRLEEGMKELSRQEQLVLRWVRIDGISYREAARLLGISINSVGPLLQRAQERLKEILRRGEGTSSG